MIYILFRPLFTYIRALFPLLAGVGIFAGITGCSSVGSYLTSEEKAYYYYTFDIWNALQESSRIYVRRGIYRDLSFPVPDYPLLLAQKNVRSVMICCDFGPPGDDWYRHRAGWGNVTLELDTGGRITSYRYASVHDSDIATVKYYRYNSDSLHRIVGRRISAGLSTIDRMGSEIIDTVCVETTTFLYDGDQLTEALSQQPGTVYASLAYFHDTKGHLKNIEAAYSDRQYRYTFNEYHRVQEISSLQEKWWGLWWQYQTDYMLFYNTQGLLSCRCYLGPGSIAFCVLPPVTPENHLFHYDERGRLNYVEDVYFSRENSVRCLCNVADADEYTWFNLHTAVEYKERDLPSKVILPGICVITYDYTFYK